MCKIIASLGIILNIALVTFAVIIMVGGRREHVAAGSLLFLSSLLSLALNGCLVHGVNHLRASLLVPSLVFNPLHCISVVVLLATVWFLEIISIIVSVLLITVHVLIWLIIFASWQQIKEEKKSGGTGKQGETIVKS